MRYGRIFLKQYWMGLKLYTRVPAALFWLIAFPVVMLLGLGTATQHADEGVHLLWIHPAVLTGIDSALATALTERGVIVEPRSAAEAELRWQQGKVPALLEGGDGRLTLRINSYFASQGLQLDSALQQAFLVAQARAAGAAEPARIPLVRSSPGGHRDGPYVAYLLPGLLGLNLLMMGIFNAGMVDVTLREKGGYRRLATTPLPRHVYLAAQVCVRFTVVMVSGATLMTVGALMFGIHNQGSYVSLLALLLLGAATFISLGYLLGSLAHSVESYSGIANFVFLPLMLLSGVYFSLDAAPDWLQRGADLLPLASLITALRGVFNDGAGLPSLSRPLGVLAAWTVLLFLLAARRFRWV